METGEGKKRAIDGLAIEHLLKDKLQRDASILGTVFADVRTVVCQNKCSGHGVCNDDTRACFCEAFWMPSFGYFWGIEEANCGKWKLKKKEMKILIYNYISKLFLDWSVLYVFVGVIVSLLILSAIFWVIAMACRQSKKPRSRPKVQKYSLIGTQDEEAPNCKLNLNKIKKNYLKLNFFADSRTNTSLTDSETDSDVLFESRSKSNGSLRLNGSTKNKLNGHDRLKYPGKHGRKIKT